MEEKYLETVIKTERGRGSPQVLGKEIPVVLGRHLDLTPP